jgi:hypothetical protein
LFISDFRRSIAKGQLHHSTAGFVIPRNFLFYNTGSAVSAFLLGRIANAAVLFVLLSRIANPTGLCCESVLSVVDLQDCKSYDSRKKSPNSNVRALSKLLLIDGKGLDQNL